MKKITIITILTAFFANMSFASEVNIFSARHYDSDIQLYEKFTSKTGIKVNVVIFSFDWLNDVFYKLVKFAKQLLNVSGNNEIHSLRTYTVVPYGAANYCLVGLSVTLVSSSASPAAGV